MAENIYDEINNHIRSGTIVNATKQQLETYAAALCQSEGNRKVYAGNQYSEICSTVRMLLMVRISEESNKEATRISKIALAVAVFALICGAVQVILGEVSLTNEATIQVQCPTAKDAIMLQSACATSRNAISMADLSPSSRTAFRYAAAFSGDFSHSWRSDS
jgi:uncharacterized protein YjaG (DUF416 family)